MVKRPQILEESAVFQRKILCFLHYHFAQSEDHVFTAYQIKKSMKDGNERFINIALEALSQTPLVQTSNIDINGEPSFESYYFITHEGIEEVEDWSDDLYENIANDIIFPNEGLVQETPNISNQTEKERDEEWEPLPLERTSETYKAAVEAVEVALSEIEGNNGYASAEPEKRDQVIWSLRTGLKYIKDGLPNREQVTTILLRPLRYIAKKFADASMGEAAKAAVTALTNWLLS